jgi:tRNA(Arg) A34 adenosine deaminase TadA
VLNVLNHAALNHQLVVDRGLLAEESALLLREFFQRRRPSRVD